MASYKEQCVTTYLQRASELLGSAGRAVVLDWLMSKSLLRHATAEGRRGATGERPLQIFEGSRRGHDTFLGLERYRLSIDGHTVRAVRICHQLENLLNDELGVKQLWVVEANHYVRLYRFLRRTARRQVSEEEIPPIMQEADMSRLVENTTGFLSHGREVLQRYGVPQKRGVLLLGEPGNGKTMACRWLYSRCRQLGLEWQHVSTEAYQQARAHGMTQTLFSLESPGIVLFDDFEIGIRNREEFGPTADHSTILSELDGISQRQGVVYLFTTNARLDDLDPAFLRRGRIDQVIHFPRPDAALRQQLVERFWHSDIQQVVNSQRVVADTEGLSFAEVEELKKLLVLHYIDTQSWDWQWALSTFRLSASQDKAHDPIGFGSSRRQRPANGSLDQLLGVSATGPDRTAAS